MEHAWGESRIVHQRKNVIVTAAEATVIGAKSSLHTHRYHHNGILVIAGLVVVEQYGPTDVVSRTMLAAGCQIRVLAGVRHRLVFPEPAELIETYVPTSLFMAATLADIEREDMGSGPEWEEPSEVNAAQSSGR